MSEELNVTKPNYCVYRVIPVTPATVLVCMMLATVRAFIVLVCLHEVKNDGR